MKFLRAFAAISFQLVFETIWMIHLLQWELLLERIRSYPVFSILVGLDDSQFFGGHLLLSFVASLFICPFFKKRFDIPRHSWALFGIFSLLSLLSFFGSLLIFATTLYFFLVQKDPEIKFSKKKEEEEIFQFFEFEPPETTMEELREIVFRELEVEPYVDILKSDNVEFKKGVINKLGSLVSPVSVKLLKMGLRDETYETRLLSAKSLAKIEEKMEAEILISESNVKKNPKNNSYRNALGQIYYRYATLGLLDLSTQRFYFDKAINELLISLQFDAKQEEILLLVGKLLLTVGNGIKAEEIFKRVIDLNPKLYEGRELLCEAYLLQNRVNDISRECQKIEEEFGEIPEKKELIHYWKSAS